MKGTRKIWLSGLVALATLFAGTASATLYLPESSYEGGNWQGTSLYQDNDFYVSVDFAVYDTANLQLAGETALAGELSLSGQYIYAYQIFNQSAISLLNAAYFGILDIDEQPIDEALINDDTGCYDDASAGVAPTPEDSEIQGTWVWTSDGGYVLPGLHSWFLVFSSDHAPVPGSYEIRSPEQMSDNDIPVVPEPTMIALLGFGGVIAVSTKRRLRSK